jgi:hypothetical protein
MKRALLLLLMCTSAWAQNSSLNLQMPYGFSNYQSDKFRAGDLDCSNAIGGGTNVEFGVTGIINNADGLLSTADPNTPKTKDIGVYARITIPLDGVKERVNCNTLYQLELQKKRLEVERLETELANLRKLQQSGGKFEN